MSSSDKDRVASAGAGDEGSGGTPPREKHIIPGLEPLIFLLAMCAFPFIKLYRVLRKYSYDLHPFSKTVGYVVSMGAGIATGYWTGWRLEWTAAWWIFSGVIAFGVTFLYGWPALYAGIIRNLGRAAEALWDAVDEGESNHNRYNRLWVSELLMFLSYLAVIGGAAAVGLNAMSSAWQSTYHVNGWWFPFATVASLFVGALVGIGGGAIVWALLATFRMRFIAVATGVASVYALSSGTAGLVEHWLSSLPVAPAVVTSVVYAAYAIQFLLYIAYVFPLSYVVLAHGLQWVFDRLGDLLEKVYGESKTQYQTFFAQTINLWTTYHLAALSLLVWPLVGMSVSAYLTLPVAVLIGFIAYVVLGEIFSKWDGGNALVGVIVSCHAAAKVGFAYFAHGYMFGVYGAVVAGLLTGVLMFVLGFPLVYLTARAILRFFRVDSLGSLLDRVHKAIFDGVDTVVEEIAHAYDNTYSDTTSHREVFLQLVNIATAAAVGFGVHTGAGLLGFAPWLLWSSVAVLAGLSYVLVGKGLVVAQNKYEKPTGNKIVGNLVGLALGIVAGVFAFWSVAYGFWTACGIALVVGLFVAGITYSLVFPIAYVLLKVAGYIVREEKWLYPILTGIHNRVWNVCASTWQRAKEYYNMIDRSIQPILQSVKDTWESAMKRVRESWDRASGNDRDR
jgi:hypothetical protein